MSKSFFIIPGFKDSASDKQYQWLISHIKKNGWKPIVVPVVWNYRTLTQNAVDFVDFYHKNKGEENQILGFSYGAVVTLLSATKVNPDHIYLCSLSPDFKEDFATMPNWLKKYIGKKRCEDILTRSAVTLAKELKVPATIFYSEKEAVDFPSIKKRAEETAKYAQDTKLIIVSNSPHQIDSREYIESLKNNLRF